MNIKEFTNTDILMEGDAVTITEETVYVENIVLFTLDEAKIIESIDPTETVRLKTPLIFDRHGYLTWMC